MNKVTQFFILMIGLNIAIILCLFLLHHLYRITQSTAWLAFCLINLAAISFYLAVSSRERR